MTVTDNVATSPHVNLALFHHLLGVPSHEGFVELARAAFADSHQLGTLVLSAGELAGEKLGSGSHEVVERKRQRVADYASVYESTSAAADVTQFRGLELANAYPDGYVRVSNDLDLAVTDERELWKAAHEVARVRDIKRLSFVVFGYPERQIYLGLRWDPVDPVFDDMGHVELCTAAYSERWATLTPLRDIPSDPDTKNLLSLAEEGFSRTFRIRDIVDVVALLPRLPDVNDIAAAATQWRSAPELLTLINYVDESCLETGIDTSYLKALACELARPAQEEKHRRYGLSPWGGAETDMAQDRIRTGHRLHGELLDSRPSTGDVLTIEEISGGIIGSTPIGHFLLAKKGMADESTKTAARDHLESSKQ